MSIELRNSGLEISDAGKWFVTTALFKNGGQVVAGPFPTRAAATADREATEKAGGSLKYWIDQAPRTLVRFNPQAAAVSGEAEKPVESERLKQ